MFKMCSMPVKQSRIYCITDDLYTRNNLVTCIQNTTVLHLFVLSPNQLGWYKLKIYWFACYITKYKSCYLIACYCKRLDFVNMFTFKPAKSGACLVFDNRGGLLHSRTICALTSWQIHSYRIDHIKKINSRKTSEASLASNRW